MTFAERMRKKRDEADERAVKAIVRGIRKTVKITNKYIITPMFYTAAAVGVIFSAAVVLSMAGERLP